MGDSKHANREGQGRATPFFERFIFMQSEANKLQWVRVKNGIINLDKVKAIYKTEQNSINDILERKSNPTKKYYIAFDFIDEQEPARVEFNEKERDAEYERLCNLLCGRLPYPPVEAR